MTIDLALAWARQPAGSADWWRARLSTVRGFACYLNGMDHSNQIPPHNLLAGGYQRVGPYIYTEAQVTRLMNAAGNLTPDLRAATYTTSIGLIVTTGMRPGEVLRLDRGDIDWDEGVLAVHGTKFNKSRE
ncbi:MAG: tyrosine-type recombinase/integrase, partial [Chloroflexota bacterium]|nr:tyrosine-type recombinase/integrase [Chloroflexota bacterium]